MPEQGVHSSPGTTSIGPLPYGDIPIRSITVLLREGEQVERTDVVLAVHSTHSYALCKLLDGCRGPAYTSSSGL